MVHTNFAILAMENQVDSLAKGGTNQPTATSSPIERVGCHDDFMRIVLLTKIRGLLATTSKQRGFYIENKSSISTFSLPRQQDTRVNIDTIVIID